MYVLSSERAELHKFSSPEVVPGGYAILSHVWDGDEQTFEDIQNIANECKKNGTNPRDFVSDKVRQCCILAERHGHKWIWNDTCCIDKRSSSELSEAINSMFRYYSLAEVCYAYLRDVPSSDVSSFRRSRWHSRGWTLQELIAPNFLIFVANNWHPLGGRWELSDVLEEITKIPARLLRLEAEVSNYSIAQRMSWAATRETTREEDKAYSLMGLFGIHMPTLYGEGGNAFRRLQEEIMKQSVDPSLFLWGNFAESSWDRILEETLRACDHEDRYSYLLASSPTDFDANYCSDIEYRPFDAVAAQIDEPRSTESQATSPTVSTTFDSRRLPAFTTTPFGVHAHLPVIQGPNPRSIILAILPCYRQGKHFGLILSPCMRPSDPSRPLYHPAVGFSRSNRIFIFDGIPSLPFSHDESVAIIWRDVYITASPPLLQNPRSTALPTPLINRMLSPSFRISETTLTDPLMRYHWMHPELPRSLTWMGTPHIAVVYQRVIDQQFIALLLGRCKSHFNSRSPGSGQLGPHWAAGKFYTSLDEARTRISELEAYEHECPGDHVLSESSVFYAIHPRSPYGWHLSFTRCQISPGTTFVVEAAYEHRSYTSCLSMPQRLMPR